MLSSHAAIPDLQGPCRSETVAETLLAALESIPSQRLRLVPPPESPAAYRRVILSQDEQLEVTTARWAAEGQSSLHGHGDSAAVYRVVSGVVREERYIPEGDSLRFEAVILKEGDSTYLPPGSFHRLQALEPAVTLHAYSPPPANHTTEVPAETILSFEEARRRAGVPRYDEGAGFYLAPSRRAVVQIVEELAAGWGEREAQATRAGELSMPADTLADMRSSGLLAAPMPEQLGGWDSSLGEVAAAVRLLARHAPATALALVMPLGNAATTRIPVSAVSASHREALVQGQRWIAHQVRRGKILAVANSEPGGGGDLASTKTTAKREADGTYHLTGRKSFATFGRDADYFLCAARNLDSGKESGRPVVDGFFVARDAVGLTIDDRWNPVGMRPTASVGLTLNSSAAAALLGYPGCLEGVNARHWSTVLFAAVFVGVGEGALREGRQHLTGSAIWARSTLAECALTLDAAAGFLEAVAGDVRWPLPSEAQERTRRAKTFAARAAVETATRAAMISGGRSYTPDHPVFRFLCDALAGPLLRPPMSQAMDSVVRQLFPGEHLESRAA